MYDFAGWVTKSGIKCSDGVTIKHGAFDHCNGKEVPLVWNHQHKTIDSILGKAKLYSKPEGIWAECFLNNTQSGITAKETVRHGDIKSLSMFANNIERIGDEVVNGNIKEVSMVVAGANPGAYIESTVCHNEPMDEDDTEGIFYCGEEDGLTISHADGNPEEKPNDKTEDNKEEQKDDKTVGDVINSLTDEQKAAVAILLAESAASEPNSNESEKKEDNEMKHNLFADKNKTNNIYISHSDMETVLNDAKRLGSLKAAVIMHSEEGGILSHSIDTTGMETSEGSQTYGFRDPEMLFPEFQSLNAVPEWISRNMGWVDDVLNSVHRTPFSRIKSVFADITEDEARARGYMKGKMKKEEFFTILKRTTSPCTVYKKQKIDRDDVIDITGFDVVAWIRSEMRMMLNEELARAILIGDGRPTDSDDKIKEDYIRPIVKDVPLFNIKVVVKTETTDDEATIYKKVIREIIRSRKDYKGSGNPTFYTTQDVISEMLLIEDATGRPLYKSEDELKTALRVSKIVPVEVMDNYKLEVETKPLPLIGVIVNLKDYNVGADKGGAINMFDDFDIDYNQQKYLIETRCSGALVKPFSALTYVLDKGGVAG